MNIFAAAAGVQPSSTINLASRSRAFGVRAALAWDTKASWCVKRFLDSSTSQPGAFAYPATQSRVTQQRPWTSHLGRARRPDRPFGRTSAGLPPVRSQPKSAPLVSRSAVPKPGHRLSSATHSQPGGTSARIPLASSSSAASRSIVESPRGAPTSWTPRGSPALLRPAGMLMAGCPVQLYG